MPINASPSSDVRALVLKRLASMTTKFSPPEAAAATSAQEQPVDITLHSTTSETRYDR